MKIKQKLIEKFLNHFDVNEPRVFQAPGRVNLIGEHTDYNAGYVFPMAIDRTTKIAIARRTDKLLNIWSENMQELVTINFNNPVKKKDHWSDYVTGVATTLINEGFVLDGAEVFIESDVPVGSGLSSSAALEVSVGFALLTINNHKIDRKKLALLCQKAENDFVGMNCGIMDQYIACHARADKAMFLDCRTLDYKLIPLNPEAAQIVICNTMVKHELSGSEYNIRRSQCEQGVQLLSKSYPGIKALRDVSLAQFHITKSNLPDIIQKRCRHVIAENERVLLTFEELKKGKLEAFGNLMNASHDSLRDDYEVSCKELDIMVNIARKLPGVYGARMTGGGFGGCTVNLVETEYVDQFCTNISKQYREHTGLEPDIYVCSPSDGVNEILECNPPTGN
jgi:galactokinase